MDPFNHPASNARLNFEQSWKRTGGWALEEILVRHYGPQLTPRGIRIFVALGEEKERLASQLVTRRHLIADKLDVFLTGNIDDTEHCFGVVHVKASFAERRTDDVPMSEALVEAGYFSPLWTMDSKATPSAAPINRGELGRSSEPRNDKRRDIEVEGSFSACFSYNSNTEPTTATSPAARIYVENFKEGAEDVFVQRVVSEWQLFLDRTTPA